MNENIAPVARSKKRRGCLIAVIVVFAIVVGIVILGAVLSQTLPRSEPLIKQSAVSILFEAEQFSRLSEDQLISLLGEPTEKEDWTNKTSDITGYKMTTYRYLDGDVCYEYNFTTNIEAEKPLVYMIVLFNYDGNKSNMGVALNTDIFARLGIVTNKAMLKEGDTGTAIRWSNVSGKVVEVWAQSLSSEDKMVDWIKIKFDPNFPL